MILAGLMTRIVFLMFLVSIGNFIWYFPANLYGISMDNAITTTLSLDNLGELFQIFLSGKNPGTLQGYRSDLEVFRIASGFATRDEAIKDLLSHGNGHANLLVLKYVTKLQDAKQAASTINRKIASLRALVTAARTVGLITWTLDVKGIKREQKDMHGPGKDGVLKLLVLAQSHPDPITAARDTAILWLLFGMALRRGEVSSLNAEHITNTSIMVLGKGRKVREALTMTASVKAALAGWEKKRPPTIGTEAPVFVALDRAHFGHRLSTTSIYTIVKGYGKMAGLGDHIRPHGLRHAAITLALDVSEGNVRKVQKFSRHADANMLLRYDDNRRDLGGDMAKEMDVSLKIPQKL